MFCYLTVIVLLVSFLPTSKILVDSARLAISKQSCRSVQFRLAEIIFPEYLATVPFQSLTTISWICGKERLIWQLNWVAVTSGSFVPMPPWNHAKKSTSWQNYGMMVGTLPRTGKRRRSFSATTEDQKPTYATRQQLHFRTISLKGMFPSPFYAHLYYTETWHWALVFATLHYPTQATVCAMHRI